MLSYFISKGDWKNQFVEAFKVKLAVEKVFEAPMYFYLHTFVVNFILHGEMAQSVTEMFC